MSFPVLIFLILIHLLATWGTLFSGSMTYLLSTFGAAETVPVVLVRE